MAGIYTTAHARRHVDRASYLRVKYKGIELGLLKQLFNMVGVDEWIHIISQEPTGQYSRKIWFLYEWLMGSTLDLPDMTVGNYIDIVDGVFDLLFRSCFLKNFFRSTDWCPNLRILIGHQSVWLGMMKNDLIIC